MSSRVGISRREEEIKAALAEHEDFFKSRFSEAELVMLFESLRRLQH